MDEDLLKEKGLKPINTTLAKLSGYGLRIGERATLVKSVHEQSYGTVIQLSEGELEKLYGDESVADYLPESITATDLEGNKLLAICYILPIESLSGQNRSYAKSLATIATKIGLPEEYLGEIETWIN